MVNETTNNKNNIQTMSRTNYLIEVTADACDGDYVNENYIGTADDVLEAQEAVFNLQVFHKQYLATHPDQPQARQGDVIDDLDLMLAILDGNCSRSMPDDATPEWIRFVKDNILAAHGLMKWVWPHWPTVDTVLRTCHTLHSVKAYHLASTEPEVVFKEKA